jgi:TPR repeat protein
MMFQRTADRNRQFDAGIMALKEDRGWDGVRILEPLAEAGDQQAQSILGEVYALGEVNGVPRNDELAIRWFRAAGPMDREPRQGEDPAAEAEYWVGKSYAEGSAPYHLDVAEGRKWLERAARGGSREAAAMLKQQK